MTIAQFLEAAKKFVSPLTTVFATCELASSPHLKSTRITWSIAYVPGLQGEKCSRWTSSTPEDVIAQIARDTTPQILPEMGEVGTSSC
jgi:hypothetical protein